MNWFKKKKIDWHPPRTKYTLYDFLMVYYRAEHEVKAMAGYIYENKDCCAPDKKFSGELKKRYNIRGTHLSLAWYLLEQYFKGNITIKDELDSETL